MTAQATSPFLSEDYTADRNIVKHYHKHVSKYLAKKKGVSEQKILSTLWRHVQPNTNGFKDRRVKVLIKNKYGDRELKVKTASDFFKDVEANNYHLSPSMVAYKHSDEEQSVNAIGTEKFLKLRSVYKSKYKDAIAAGDAFGEKAFFEIQNALKIFNNAQSGAMSSNGTPLNNKTGHTTLTSICRALTSTANFCNEKLLAGNRFFNSAERVLENFLSLLGVLDLKRMQSVMDQLGMRHATADEVMSMVRHCSYRYWDTPSEMKIIEEWVGLCTPIELTALLCNMDLNGLTLTNQSVMYEFFDDFSKIPECPADAKIEDYPKPPTGDHWTLCVSKLPSEHTDVQIYHLNAYHQSIEEKWKDFIEVFLKAPIPPSGVYEITDMIREVVQTSDTDSSIYTVDLVVEKYTEDTNVSLRLNGVLTFIIRMVSIHHHAQLSANLNVAKRHQNRLTMKNEYMFGSYVTTLMSKHYYATQVMVEGVIKPEIKMEIKGVHLRSSNVARNIKEFSHKLMREVLDSIYHRKKLNAADILANVGDLERQIIKEIKEGSWLWLSRKTVKDAKVYAKPESSIYQYHVMWEEVFADKYGAAPQLPYSVVKINTKLGNRLEIEDYLEAMTDVTIKENIKKYLEKYDKDKITTFYVPSELLPRLGGLPDEVIDGANIRLIIAQNLKSVYAVLESCGLYINNEKMTRLISDEH